METQTNIFDVIEKKTRKQSSKVHTQHNAILEVMRNRPINTQIARGIGILSLSRRICDLKEMGHEIKAEMQEVESQWGKTKVAFYYLIKERVQP